MTLQWGETPAIYLDIVACIYPIGLGPALARILAWPYFWIHAAAIRMVERIRARLAIASAVRKHRERNRALVGKRGAQAVCRQHLARFKRQRVKLAYGRTWVYWSCRVCKDDTQAIPAVKILRGVFDEEITDGSIPMFQEGNTLSVNLLQVGGALPIPVDLDEVYIAAVTDPHDIERFIVAYQNAEFPVKAPKLDEIRLTIVPNTDLDLNIRNMLLSRLRT